MSVLASAASFVSQQQQQQPNESDSNSASSDQMSEIESSCKADDDGDDTQLANKSSMIEGRDSSSYSPSSSTSSNVSVNLSSKVKPSHLLRLPMGAIDSPPSPALTNSPPNEKHSDNHAAINRKGSDYAFPLVEESTSKQDALNESEEQVEQDRVKQLNTNTSQQDIVLSQPSSSSSSSSSYNNASFRPWL
ncbi:hypothetical protein BDF19DRAFT_444834 [Syncephalis fuscata]|nr:hypothetical protein BDF19DRAFT_444834 [Syncephalis fuscata]